jgi:hypothetical protein
MVTARKIGVYVAPCGAQADDIGVWRLIGTIDEVVPETFALALIGKMRQAAHVQAEGECFQMTLADLVKVPM